MMTSLAPDQLTPPLMEDLQYTTYISPDAPLLTTLTYMDGNKHKHASVCFFTEKNKTKHFASADHSQHDPIIFCGNKFATFLGIPVKPVLGS